jgi:hypothetical protein
MERPRAAEDRAGVARLILLVGPPYHLALEEAEDWLRGELLPVTGATGVRSAVLSRLSAASWRESAESGWLVELDFESADSARRTAGDERWVALLGDLRLVGMRPTVALVDSTDQLGF